MTYTPVPPIESNLLADALGGATPVSGLTRRVAVVTAIADDATCDVTWASGGSVANLPIVCDPWPQVGDVVLLLGAGEAAKDYAVWGVVGRAVGDRPQAGRGIVCRAYTATDSLFSDGPAEFTIGEMTTDSGDFFADRLYRSTFSLNLTAIGGGDGLALRVKRSGPVTKWTGAGYTVGADPSGVTTLTAAVDYGMPDGTYTMLITADPVARAMKFYAGSNAFHTVEDIGPRNPWTAN